MLSSGVQNTWLPSVIGGDEAHALIGKLDRVGMGEDLEAARVREDGTVPVHEVVQAAELGHRIGARAHGQVIGIGEHDLAPRSFTVSVGMPLTLALVPTGMKIGVSISPCGVWRMPGARMRLGILGDDLVFEQGLVHETAPRLFGARRA